MLGRWGAWVARHALWAVATWGVILVLAVLLAGRFSSHLSANGMVVRGSDSQAAAAQIRASFPSAASETDLVVLHSDTHAADDSAFRDRVAATVAAFKGAERVTSVTDPYDSPETSISADRHTALVRVGLSGDAGQTRAAATGLGQRAEALATDGFEVSFTGRAALNAAAVDLGNEDLGRAERIGLPVAALVLLIAFGSVVAASIPLLLGFACVLATFGVLGTISTVVTFDSFVRSAVSMVGIALGIDYSLFIVTRFREELARGQAGPAAIGRVTATAGAAVLYSGTTVVVSLSGLLLVRSDTVRATALGMMTAVLVMLAVTVTLLPAVLALLGARVNRLALPWMRRSMAHPDDERSIWARLAEVSMRRPVIVTAVAVAALGALALPALGLRYGADTSLGAVGDTPAGRGMARVSEAFAPGVIAPITVVVSGLDGDQTKVAQLTNAASNAPGVAGVTSTVDGTGTTALITVVPNGTPDSDLAQQLVGRLRADARTAVSGTPLTVHVGGSPAEIADMITENDRATPLVIAAVLGASLLLLLWAFRSLLLPIKAIVMNLFSVGAAFGAMVLVFQEGHGASLLGVDRTGFIQVMIPLLAFAIVFGLSMDYEVFMLSRMRETWERVGDNRVAVRTGIVRTAPVITAAAAIMIVIFSSFAFTRVTDLKQLGFMLAVAVFVDATVIRLLLVPALMRLMGRWNWWLPYRSRRAASQSAARRVDARANQAS
jgi:RND superfamily putative drug exporter